MIAEKLSDQLDWLERAVKRGNGDLHDITIKVLGNMRTEIARVHELEASGMITVPEQKEGSCGEAR